MDSIKAENAALKRENAQLRLQVLELEDVERKEEPEVNQVVWKLCTGHQRDGKATMCSLESDQATCPHPTQTPILQLPPEVVETILSYLGCGEIKTLLSCRKTCWVFKNWVDKRSSLWNRVSLEAAVKDNQVDICQLIMSYAKNKNPRGQIGWTPLHYAAIKGHTEIARLIVENVEVKNPGDDRDQTPLHFAALHGNTEIARLIMENVGEKNPVNKFGLTPLHMAAQNGYTEIARLIVENVDDKNPGDYVGNTPLHNAVAWRVGHMEIARLIMDNLEDKNPGNNGGRTPLHEAAQRGHIEICQLILENIQEKNPKDNSGRTPLNMARTQAIKGLFKDQSRFTTDQPPIQITNRFWPLANKFGTDE